MTEARRTRRAVVFSGGGARGAYEAGVARYIVEELPRRLGRPVKIEGNRLHPFSRGATNAETQAAILELYDPDRSRTPARLGGGASQEETWESVDRFLAEHGTSLRGRGGRGLRVLAESSSSPALARVRDRWQREFPEARWAEWEPMTRDEIRLGSELADRGSGDRGVRTRVPRLDDEADGCRRHEHGTL